MLVSLFLFALPSHAVTWEFVGEQPVLSGSTEIDLAKSVGKVTMDVLWSIPDLTFVATEDGVSEINGLKNKKEEDPNGRWVKYYGWCYSVNDEVPDQIPSHVWFHAQSDHLKWYYAYALYEDGAWKSYCTPVYPIR